MLKIAVYHRSIDVLDVTRWRGCCSPFDMTDWKKELSASGTAQEGARRIIGRIKKRASMGGWLLKTDTWID